MDYRIPLVRWILRHGRLPNWPWSMVDDYPMLGELLMVPLYAIKPGLARLVPIAAYVGLGAAGGSLLALWGRQSSLQARTLFLLGFAWALALRPVAIQSNLLMIDNLASAFLLGSLALVLRERFALAGALAAASMATRYTTWGGAAFLGVLCFFAAPRWRRLRAAALFGAIAALGPLPVMVRNFLLNAGNPFFPIGSKAAMAAVGVDGYGRGKDLWSFLRLPWDLLYTNTFVEGIFDYTVGKLFYLQLAAAATAAIFAAIPSPWPSRSMGLSIAFALIYLVIWFGSGQQMRFLVPALLVFDLLLLLFLLKVDCRATVGVVTALGALSALSVQKDSLRMVFLGHPSIFAPAVLRAESCFARAGVGAEPIGLIRRGGHLGFFEKDFVFLVGHPYGLESGESSIVPWIFSMETRAGYVPWPKTNPCLLKRAVGEPNSPPGT